MSLNHACLMGRITHDLEMKQTQNGVSVLSFSIAVERGYAKQGEERQTDFIDCVAWRQTAEMIAKWFGKGRLIAIEGELQTRNYEDKNGVKHKVTEVQVSNVSFTGEKKSDNAAQSVPSGQPPIADVPAEFETVDDSGVPF